MDSKLTHYQQLLKTIVIRQSQVISSDPNCELLPVCDLENNQFLVIDTGWNVAGRVHNLVFHARIKNDKIWIEWDGFENGVTEELLEAGVPHQDIVLAFYRPERRKLTDFAVA